MESQFQNGGFSAFLVFFSTKGSVFRILSHFLINARKEGRKKGGEGRKARKEGRRTEGRKARKQGTKQGRNEGGRRSKEGKMEDGRRKDWKEEA